MPIILTAILTVFFSLFLIWLGLCLVSLLIHELRLFLLALKNYRACRGTHHLRTIRQAQSRLMPQLTEIRNQRVQVESLMEEMKQGYRKDIQSAAETFIVNNFLSNAPGLGPALCQRIIDGCFDGTIQSLRSAHALPGIGQAKAESINSWIDTYQAIATDLADSDFPGKKEIDAKHNELRQKMDSMMKSVQDQLTPFEELALHGERAQMALGKISVLHFYRALKLNKTAAVKVSVYIHGIFPEWEPQPEWFAELTAQFGC